MPKTNFKIASRMGLREIKIKMGTNQCKKPVPHEREVRGFIHRWLAPPLWVDLIKCRECDYFLAESTTGTRKIICCYGAV